MELPKIHAFGSPTVDSAPVLILILVVVLIVVLVLILVLVAVLVLVVILILILVVLHKRQPPFQKRYVPIVSHCAGHYTARGGE